MTKLSSRFNRRGASREAPLLFFISFFLSQLIFSKLFFSFPFLTSPFSTSIFNFHFFFDFSFFSTESSVAPARRVKIQKSLCEDSACCASRFCLLRPACLP